MADFKDRVVLITGSSSGIGAATALHFAKYGAKLALVARNLAKLEEVAEQCRTSGSPEVVVISQDLSNEEGCDSAMEETLQHFKALDVLINNAGMMHTENLQKLTGRQLDEAMDINVKSALKLTQLATKSLEKSPLKAIVNVSSIAGLRASTGSLAYKISKAAMDQLTRCSALELAPKGIRVNSVNPGVIDTDFFVNSGLSEKASDNFVKEKSKKIHALGRCGQPEEVAKAIAFLASLDASFICGQTLAVDGGRSITCPS